MKELATSRSPSTRSLTLIRYGLLIIGPAAGILCGFWISRGFHRSISRISITLNDVASEMREQVGRVDVRESGELPSLQEQVTVVVARIREVMQQLNEARRQAISAERLAALGEMAAGVAHELRNPLTSVKLLIQRSAQRPQRSMTEKQLGVVLEEIARMETTIDRMLDFARPPRMSRILHDLREVVTRALSLIEGRAHQVDVVIISDLPAAPVWISADSEQLHQVFSNLAQNAIEAMPNGGKLCATIEAETSESTCRVVLSDTGAGISPEVLTRLFEPFVTDKARGTGLGLAVSNRIVKEHGGLLIARNRAEGGAVFTVELPLLDPSQAPLNSPSSATQASFAPSSPIIDVEKANAQIAHH
jgi:signal transduction histidine kinase